MMVEEEQKIDVIVEQVNEEQKTSTDAALVTSAQAVAAQKRLMLGNSRSVTDFAKVQQIGTGTYGVVFLAKDKRTGKQYALK